MNANEAGIAWYTGVCAGKVMEWRWDGGAWYRSQPLLNGPGNVYEVREVRPTVTINDVEVVRGETVAPAPGTECFLASLTAPNTCQSFTWTRAGDDFCLFWLSRGLVFLNRDDCIAMSKALIGAAGGRVE